MIKRVCDICQKEIALTEQFYAIELFFQRCAAEIPGSTESYRNIKRGKLEFHKQCREGAISAVIEDLNRASSAEMESQ